MTVPQPPPQADSPSEAHDQMRVIAAATELAETFRNVVPTSRLWYGMPHVPFDITFSTSQYPEGFGWEMTICRNDDWRSAMSICSLSQAPGSTDVDSTWNPEAGPYLAALAFTLTMRLWKHSGKAAA
jgi:hypothetical protein